MSTKIHNGYYIDKCTLEELHELCTLLRHKIGNELERLYATKLMSTAVRLMDSAYLYNAGLYGIEVLNEESKSIDGKTPISAAYDIIVERSNKIERTKIRDPEFDFRCEVVFVPVEGLEDEKNTNLLATIFTERQTYIEIWESQSLVHPFFYWDNTDKPDEIPQEEWDLRRDAWETVQIPSMQGFTAILTHPYLPLPTEGVLEHAEKPSYERRVSNATWTVLMARYTKEKEIKLSAMNFRRVKKELEKWVAETADGVFALQEANAQVRKVLKRQITTDILTKEITLKKQAKTRAHFIEWGEEGGDAN